jgi:hypothetical protein
MTQKSVWRQWARRPGVAGFAGVLPQSRDHLTRVRRLAALTDAGSLTVACQFLTFVGSSKAMGSTGSM